MEKSTLAFLHSALQLKKTELEVLTKTIVQNGRGVDVKIKDQKGAGSFSITLSNATLLNMENNQEDLPSLYMSVNIPSNMSDAHEKTHVTNLQKTTCPVWNETLLLTQMKSKRGNITISLKQKEEYIADKVIGTYILPLTDFLNQEVHFKWISLYDEEQQVTETARVFCRLQFTYNKQTKIMQAITKLEMLVEKLVNQKGIYAQTSKLMQVESRHPASFGIGTSASQLHLPSHRYSSTTFHPASVVPIPLPDKTAVVTPFGNGTILAYRSVSNVYVVQLPFGIGYLTRDNKQITEREWTTDWIGKTVSTPYGTGRILSESETAVSVQLSYGVASVQRNVVQLDLADMSGNQLVTQAEKARNEGNVSFQKMEWNASIQSYLHALGYVQNVSQENATHKLKAQVLMTMIKCHLNMGACKLKLKQYEDVITASGNALNLLKVVCEHIDGPVVAWMGRLGLSVSQLTVDYPVKARWRLAQALKNLRQFTEAKMVLMELLEMSSEHKQARTLLEAILSHVKSEKKKEKKTWGGFLNKTSHDHNEPEAPPSPVELQLKKSEAQEMKPPSTKPTPKATKSDVVSWNHFSTQTVLLVTGITALATIAVYRSSRS